MSDLTAGRPPTRVAVIAVPGIGDERAGDTVESLAGSLLAAKSATGAEADRVLVPVGPERQRHAVERRRLRRSEGVRMDLYEMAWADLSRFPAGLWAFLGTAVGLALQLTTRTIAAAASGR